MFRKKKQKTSYGIACAGGGIRAFAQVPVLRALEHESMRPSIYAGVSMGSVVAAMAALGMESFEILDKLLRVEQEFIQKKIFYKPAVKQLLLEGSSMVGGYIDGEVLEQIVVSIFGDIKITEVPTPLVIGAVDIISGNIVAFVSHPEQFQAKASWVVNSEVTLAKAIRASCSYPMVISAVPLDDMLLVDGGLLMNLPIALLQAYDPDIKLAVSMYDAWDETAKHSVWKYVNHLMEVMVKHQSVDDVANVDVHWNIRLPGINVFDMGRGSDVIDLANTFVKEHLNEMRAYAIKD